MSTLKSINVIHPSGTVNNIVNDASGNVTVGNDLYVTTGNVGIGTASPSSGVKLDVNGLMRATTWSLNGTGVTGGTAAFAAGTVSTDSNWGFYFRAPTSSSALANYSFRNSSDTALMTIDASGTVGIGTSSPGKKLDVFNSGTATTDLVVRNGTVSLLSFVDSGGGYFGTSTNHPLLITINNTERMRIDTSGNVGIGATANASAILDAQSTTKGVRFPNMTTTEKNAISSPAAGLVVFDTTLAKLCVYSGAAWQTITSI